MISLHKAWKTEMVALKRLQALTAVELEVVLQAVPGRAFEGQL